MDEVEKIRFEMREDFIRRWKRFKICFGNYDGFPANDKVCNPCYYLEDCMEFSKAPCAPFIEWRCRDSCIGCDKIDQIKCEVCGVVIKNMVMKDNKCCCSICGERKIEPVPIWNLVKNNGGKSKEIKGIVMAVKKTYFIVDDGTAVVRVMLNGIEFDVDILSKPVIIRGDFGRIDDVIVIKEPEIIWPFKDVSIALPEGDPE